MVSRRPAIIARLVRTPRPSRNAKPIATRTEMRFLMSDQRDTAGGVLMTSRTSGQHPHGALTVHDGQMVKRVPDLMGHQLAHSTGAAGVVAEDAHRQPCDWLGPVGDHPF